MDALVQGTGVSMAGRGPGKCQCFPADLRTYIDIDVIMPWCVKAIIAVLQYVLKTSMHITVVPFKGSPSLDADAYLGGSAARSLRHMASRDMELRSAGISCLPLPPMMVGLRNLAP